LSAAELAHPKSRIAFAVLGAALLAVVGSGVALVAQGRHEFQVSAHKYGYRVSGTAQPEIRVTQGELVRITFEAEDIPHSFTIEDNPGDHYRIMRRAEPGKPVVIDFRADEVGRFPFFCNLAIDERCKRETRGVLIVEPKK
jgi:heme/copper-type cytochrome/quinol oxidase subunit 2